VKTLLDELAETAREEIERAAGEAAKAAALASLDIQAAAVAEARKWRGLYRESQKDGMKNMVIAGLVCFALGTVGGAGFIMYAGK
jgi:hypothetical protein